VQSIWVRLCLGDMVPRVQERPPLFPSRTQRTVLVEGIFARTMLGVAR